MRLLLLTGLLAGLAACGVGGAPHPPGTAEGASTGDVTGMVAFGVSGTL
ncbi:argininosuccinate lyase [Rhodobacter sp. TJ_12]|nr:argininosuccinate lyase [Rhodobacter sp. TJ_12]